MDILIVDDELLARQRLSRMAEKIDAVDRILEAENAEQALQLISREDPDLVLLDIRMPGKDGLTLAHQVSLMEDPPAIVFCTAYDTHALDAFGTGAVGYLLKPVKAEQLIQVIEKAQKLNKIQRAAAMEKPQDTKNQRHHINAKTHKGVQLIPLRDIRYFIADQKYVTVFHTQGEHLLDESLKDLQEEFGERFVRIHRNALVSRQHIEALERDVQGQFYIRLANMDHKPLVSRRHVSDIKDLLKTI
jgi:two-component system, LytTR family, response regulator AlgR